MVFSRRISGGKRASGIVQRMSSGIRGDASMAATSLPGLQGLGNLAAGGGTIDFWWVKPDFNKSEKNPQSGQKRHTELDPNYMLKHESGKFKNICGSQTRAGYETIADYFRTEKTTADGRWKFSIEMVEREDGRTMPKCVITNTKPDVTGSIINLADLEGDEKYYLVAIWQENWSIMWNKFVEGRIVYYKEGLDIDGPNLYSREYHIAGEKMIVLRPDEESATFGHLLDSDGDRLTKYMIKGNSWKKS